MRKRQSVREIPSESLAHAVAGGAVFAANTLRIIQGHASAGTRRAPHRIRIGEDLAPRVCALKLNPMCRGDLPGLRLEGVIIRLSLVVEELQFAKPRSDLRVGLVLRFGSVVCIGVTA